MAASNPYNNYKEQAIMTMTPGELIIVLYEECIKMLNHAVFYIEEKNDPDEADKAIRKAQRIIHYLDGILDYKYEIASNLH
ncbi:MAG: flagellar protein FliS, partial [Oscillospiraceae bacterium]|nr:flagellar protein FliS [Oscillospiraceae bacterium]